ncbi:glutathione S-transferase family protein [Roseicitreum antarcticum]|uniref:Glutathione S-transferase n=1 Tax=Roseicitreum antarcticum TaxID=564137 RepID=A0A1H3AQG5_9RHOB|nr:glutathione S-transferase family protein [Roseicitreum antarcticum]SDX31926.1 glutathione S-transferase [Roseicitreum antarcticum]
MSEVTIYAMPSSGNTYKVRLLLAHLGRDVRVVKAEAGTPEVAALRDAGKLPLGSLPVLELPDGTLIPESNAILCYLADGTPWLPTDPVTRAHVLGWMFWEQNAHEGCIAVRGALRTYPHRQAEATPDRMAQLLDAGHRALARMEGHLTLADWLAGAQPTIADLCLFAYTHRAAHPGGFDMARFPAVTAWLARTAALPGHQQMDT